MKSIEIPGQNRNAMRLLIIVLAVFVLGTPGYSQEKAVLEVKGEASPKNIRGGEKMVYSFTVTNTSGVPAKDITIIHKLLAGFDFVSANVTQGAYETNLRVTSAGTPKIWAHFGDLQGYAGATLTIEVKALEWGDISENNSDKSPPLGNGGVRAYIDQLKGKKRDETLPPGASAVRIDYPSLFCGECVKPDATYRESISIALLPSTNIPPRVKILTPKEEQAVVRRADRPGEVTLQINAFDPDGSIQKVSVEDPEFFGPNDIFYDEDGVRKMKIQGKVYTVEELEDNPEPLKYYERFAAKTGPGTYTYTLKNLRFGYHVIHVTAYDNGGRGATNTVRFTAVGDAKIAFYGLTDKQVIRPAEFIKLQTVSTINDPGLSDLRIIIKPLGDNVWDFDSMPRPRRVSTAGNISRHEYLWKAPAEGSYNLRLYLLDKGFPTNEERIEVTVAEERLIKITSLKNGQEINRDDDLKLTVDARDVKGRHVDDELTILIDGKNEGPISNSWQPNPEKPGEYNLNAQAGRKIIIGRGRHTVQIVARMKLFILDGPEVGRSELITITVK